jgi:hypothetical protein
MTRYRFVSGLGRTLAGMTATQTRASLQGCFTTNRKLHRTSLLYRRTSPSSCPSLAWWDSWPTLFWPAFPGALTSAAVPLLRLHSTVFYRLALCCSFTQASAGLTLGTTGLAPALVSAESGFVYGLPCLRRWCLVWVCTAFCSAPAFERRGRAVLVAPDPLTWSFLVPFFGAAMSCTATKSQIQRTSHDGGGHR